MIWSGYLDLSGAFWSKDRWELEIGRLFYEILDDIISQLEGDFEVGISIKWEGERILLVGEPVKQGVPYDWVVRRVGDSLLINRSLM